MPSWDEFEPYLASLRDEWDRAEEDIKRAEQVGNQAVTPSVNELRYAGRRIVDAMHAICNGNRGDAPKLLQDALFDCHRARHDAIDAATSAIAVKLDITTDKLGYDPVLKAFPDYPHLLERLQKVREKIVQSRRNRFDRNAIYATIESVDFPKLVDRYNEFQRAEPIMRGLAKRQRRAFAVMLAAGIVAIVVAILAWLFPRSPAT
ncbi:MAG: hypothetical protein HQL40_05815 [Alphaproteobacteria bacterium]|nr:hypothetical protein [Alphaproteobacteria bacterium]